MEIDWVSWIQLSAIWLPLDYHFHSTCLSLGDHLTIISSSWRDSIDLMSSTPHPLDIHSTSTQHALNIQLKSTWRRSKVIQLTRGCSGPVYWNKGVSNSTRGCSNIQVQNNPVLSFVWLFFEFHHIHSTSTSHPLHIHSTSTPHPLDIHSTSTRPSLHIHSTSTWRPLDIHSTSVPHPLNIHLTSF